MRVFKNLIELIDHKHIILNTLGVANHGLDHEHNVIKLSTTLRVTIC